MTHKIITMMVTLSFLFFSVAHAQLKMGVYGSALLPVGDFGDIHNPGMGGGLTLKHLSSKKNLQAGVDVSYLVFRTKEETATYSSSSIAVHRYRIIPVRATIEYFFLTEKVKPFIGMEAGLYFSRSQTTGTVLYQEAISWEAFGLAPGGGLAIALSEKTDINLGVKYNVMFDGQQGVAGGLKSENGKYISINAGLVFALQ